MNAKALLLLIATVACGASAADRAPTCPAAADVAQAHLLGVWQVKFDGDDKPSMLRLAKHPEFAETVRGWLERGGKRIAVAGDVDDGALTLEESVNGTNISATWLGDVVEGSCGREIRGTWQAEGTGAKRQFVLRKR